MRYGRGLSLFVVDSESVVCVRRGANGSVDRFARSDRLEENLVDECQLFSFGLGRRRIRGLCIAEPFKVRE